MIFSIKQDQGRVCHLDRLPREREGTQEDQFGPSKQTQKKPILMKSSNVKRAQQNKEQSIWPVLMKKIWSVCHWWGCVHSYRNLNKKTWTWRNMTFYNVHTWTRSYQISSTTTTENDLHHFWKSLKHNPKGCTTMLLQLSCLMTSEDPKVDEGLTIW